MTEKNVSPPADSPAPGGYPTRVLLVWLAIGMSLLLGLLSIAGTLLPAVREALLAKAQARNWSTGLQEFIKSLPNPDTLFNSKPLMIFWIFLFMTLVMGILFSPKILRRGGSLAVHLGALLILVGSMWGSQAGHRLADRLAQRLAPSHPQWAKFLDGDRIRRGQLTVYEGEAENRLSWPPGPTLPFKVKLNDFRIEYYQPWKLQAHVPVMRKLDIGNMEIVDGVRDLPTDKGTVLDIPWTPAKVKVLDYLPHTRMQFADNIPADIGVILGPGKHITVPARPGQMATFHMPGDNANPLMPSPTATLTVNQVFDHLTIVDTPNGRKPVEDPRAPENPAVSFVVQYADGKTKLLLVAQNPTDAPGRDRGVAYEYLPREETVQIDQLCDDAAVALEVSDNGKTQRVILGGQKPLKLPLKTPVGETDYMALALQEPDLKGVKSYSDEVEIIEDGKSVLAATIAVNHPLHYKGYHIYQADFDHDKKEYAILNVVSDRGLYVVYTGFALLVTGVFWIYWIRPAIRFVRQRREGQ